MTRFDEIQATSDYLNRRLRSPAEVAGWKCPRCGVEVEGPDDCEGCRDPSCPAIYGERA